MSNHRSTDTSFIRFSFPKAEWSIRYIRPTGSQWSVCSLWSRQYLFITRVNDFLSITSHIRTVVLSTRHVLAVFVTATIIRQEKNQCIIKLSGLFQSLDNLSDTLIYTVDHCSVNGHRTGIPFCMWIIFPFVIKLTFGQKVIHSRENTQLLLTFITGITDSFPTYFISILIFLNIFRKCMQRPMRCCISQVHKEWFIILCIFFYLLYGTIWKGLGYIISFGYFLYRHFTFY